MNLTNPLALGLLALAAPVVLAYLHRRHKLKHPVSSTILMRVIRDEQPSSQRARSKLRHKLSLAMVLAALLFALIALVGPTSSTPPRRVVLVLDASASMGARVGDGGDRLARARHTVATMVEGLSKRDELALVVTGADAGLLVPPTRAHHDVLARIDALARRGAGGDNRDDALAFRLADGLCRDAAHTTLVVISDGAGLAPPPTRCPVAHLAIGAPVDNLGLTALALRSVDGMGVYDVHVAIASTATEARKAELTFTADAGTDGGLVVDVVAFDVPAGGDVGQTLRLTIEAGRTLTAALPGGDGLPQDDQVTVALPDDGPVAVLLVTSRPKSLLAEVLRLHPRVRLTVAAPGALPPGASDLIVLEDDARQALPPSPHVVGFGVAPADAPLTLGAAATELAIVRWDFDAPWFRYVDLREVFITAGRVVTGGTSIVDSGSGALASSARWGDRELFVTGWSGDQTDLALRAAFPNLIANLVDWAAPRGDRAPPPLGVLSATESHATPAALPGKVFAATAGWSDNGRLLRVALGLAVLLLIIEQLVTMRGNRR